MEDSVLHSTNIFIHVCAGSIALLLGAFALLTPKGKKLHKKSGRLFLVFLTFVIITGLIGVLVFGVNTFLLVITMLSGYLAYSGYRILQTKSNKPNLPDICIALITLFCVIYFLYYFYTIGMIWSPVIIYSTVGYLFFIISYDFLRYLIPKSKYKKLWLYEHILKMVSAFSGILSAFTGTVFSQYQPYSQFLPSSFGMVLAIGFIVYYYRKNNSQKSTSIDQDYKS